MLGRGWGGWLREAEDWLKEQKLEGLEMVEVVFQKANYRGGSMLMNQTIAGISEIRNSQSGYIVKSFPGIFFLRLQVVSFKWFTGVKPKQDRGHDLSERDSQVKYQVQIGILVYPARQNIERENIRMLIDEMNIHSNLETHLQLRRKFSLTIRPFRQP